MCECLTYENGARYLCEVCASILEDNLRGLTGLARALGFDGPDPRSESLDDLIEPKDHE